MEFFIHYELRPDIFKPSVSPRRLKEHLDPVWDTKDKKNATYLLGKGDPAVSNSIKSNLSMNKIKYRQTFL